MRCARARHVTNWAEPAGQVQPSTFRIHNVSTLSREVDAARAAAYDISIVRQRGPRCPNSSRAAAPAGQYNTRVAAPARAPPAGQPWWMWGERHGSQYALPSRDRLSSDSLEEMEARLMSRAARMLISRATVRPGACVCW